MVLLGLLIVIPAGNLLVPVNSAFHIPNYLVGLLGKYLCFFFGEAAFLRPLQQRPFATAVARASTMQVPTRFPG